MDKSNQQNFLFEGIKKGLNYLWRIYFVLLAFLFILLFAIPVLLLSIREKDFPKAYIFIRWWCLILFYGMGFRYNLIDRANLPIEKDRHYIFISNHTSIIDIMLMVVLHPKHPLCFIGKAELAKIPIFSIIYRRICILVERDNPRSRADVYRKAAIKMNHGQNIVIFPEGGVPDDTSVLLDSFKDGAFILSTKHDFPIAVYTFIGLKERFPFELDRGCPGKIKVVRNAILEPTEDIQTLKSISHDEIKNTLVEEQRAK